MSVPNKDRFERLDEDAMAGTSKFMNRWGDLGEPEEQRRRMSVGDFVARIWTLYGPPDGVGFEGFHYAFRDRETGTVFTAYAAGSGTAYGACFEEGLDHAQTESAIKAFDALLESAEPQDCEIEYETDFGVVRSGVRDGQPYDEIDEDAELDDDDDEEEDEDDEADEEGE